MEHWRNSSGAYKVSNNGNIMVRMFRGSSLFFDLDKINFLKIDVESFTKDEGELPIIRDMRGLILKHKPMILVETGFIEDILEILTGYEVKEKCLDDYLLEYR